MRGVDQTQWGWLALFASTTALICCALPILLVSVGLEAASAALFSNGPNAGVPSVAFTIPPIAWMAVLLLILAYGVLRRPPDWRRPRA